MVRFWLRELAGWILVVIGLYFFLVCLALLLNPGPGILEAPVISLIGIVIFRGGIHLLKVAVAARVCLHAQSELSKQKQPERGKKFDVPWDW